MASILDLLRIEKGQDVDKLFQRGIADPANFGNDFKVFLGLPLFFIQPDSTWQANLLSWLKTSKSFGLYYSYAR